jgi:hypothetical protein
MRAYIEQPKTSDLHISYNNSGSDRWGKSLIQKSAALIQDSQQRIKKAQEQIDRITGALSASLIVQS